MRLKWKLRLYYGALILALLALVGAATAAIVLRDFRTASESREAEVARVARRLLRERMAEVDSCVARAARDPDFLLLARLDLQTSHEATLTEWVPLGERLSQRHGLPLLKILSSEGRVLSSAHWRAAYGLADSPGLVLALEGATGTRLVRDRQAEGDFLALESPRWLQSPRLYVIVGGVRADSLLENDLTQRSGVVVRFEMSDTPAEGRADSATATVGAHALPGQSLSTELTWVPLPTSPTELAGGLRLHFDRTPLQDLERKLAQVFGIAALAGALLAWILGVWISNRVTRPLEELVDGVAVLAAGRTPTPIPMRGSTEVRDLVASFNRMAESLAESRRSLRRVERIAAWRDVARQIAHEIKNALSPIQLSVENVARGVHGGRDDVRALADESVTTVRGEIEGLTRLVDAFNELARLPDPELKPGALRQTWERAAAPFSGSLEIEAVGLEALPVLLYDDDQIRRALHNLLLNAQEAGATRVRLFADHLPGAYRLVLSDDGPGIPTADLEHVFEPYFTRKNGGSGLGLAIVYKVISDHGWTVTASSPASASAPRGRPGTALTVVIPARAATQESQHAG
jgi:signal transduction histidine kinase